MTLYKEIPKVTGPPVTFSCGLSDPNMTIFSAVMFRVQTHSEMSGAMPEKHT